jgi:aminoglycoside phosphotransferase (APT) family kinase protein
VASGNLLVRDGALAAVIDFGSSGVGDPACDLVIAWTMFSGDDRQAFRDAIDAGVGEWQRARGWALWKALITLAKDIDGSPDEAAAARAVISAVIAEHVADIGHPGRAT